MITILPCSHNYFGKPPDPKPHIIPQQRIRLRGLQSVSKGSLFTGTCLFAQPSFGQRVPEKVRDVCPRDYCRNCNWPLN